MKTIEPFRTLGYTVTLNVDDHLTVIKGDSGVGKTAVYNYFYRKFLNQDVPSLKCYDARSLRILMQSSGNESFSEELLKQLSSVNNSMVFIDNADIMVDDKIKDYMLMVNNGNSYILFGRNVNGLWVTENNVANLIRDDRHKTITLNYIFKDVNIK
jgi:hypothetical protein